MPRIADHPLVLRPTVLALMAAGCLSASLVHAQPLPTGTLPVPAANWLQKGQRPDYKVEGNAAKVELKGPATILNWNSLDVGKNASLRFEMQNATDRVLNKVTGGIINNRTTIDGMLSSNGQVYIYNPNGIVFSKTATVDVNALVASSLKIDDQRFMDGILSPSKLPQLQADLSLGRLPGAVVVQGDKEGGVLQQAAITVAKNGFILLAAPTVSNAGKLSAPDGQVAMAAGTQVFLAAPPSSSTKMRGLLIEVGSQDLADLAAQKDFKPSVTNEALGQVDVLHGNATLVGRMVNQNGLISANTSVTLNGSIYLKAQDNATKEGFDVVALAKEGGELSLGADSRNVITPDLQDEATVVKAYSFKKSEVELTGQSIVLESGSLIRAAGGTVSLTARKKPGSADDDANDSRIILKSRSKIDVSGSLDAPKAMESNVITAELRGGELADNLLLRDASLRGKTVRLDVRKAASVQLADVSGYVDQLGITVGEKTAAGGSLTLTSDGQVQLEKDSSINVSGGSLAYQAGHVNTSKLSLAGKLYDFETAKADLAYTGLVNLDNNSSNFEAGYRQGMDAGSVTVTAHKFSLDGSLQGHVFPGVNQRDLAAKAPKGAELKVTVPKADPKADPNMGFSLSKVEGSQSLDLQGLANEQGFRRFTLNLKTGVEAKAALNLPAMTHVTVNSTGDVHWKGSVSSVGGSVTVTGTPDTNIDVDANVKFDFAGAWVNDAAWVAKQGGGIGAAMPGYAIKGGNLSLTGKKVSLGDGVVVDVSGGGWMGTNGKVTAGDAGNITLTSTSGLNTLDTALKLGNDLELKGYGLKSGGKLTLTGRNVWIGLDEAAASSKKTAGDLAVTPEFLKKGGFTTLSLTANGNLEVMPGVQLELVPESWQLPPDAFQKASAPMSLVASKAKLDLAASSGLAVRPSSTLTLRASSRNVDQEDETLGRVRVGAGALLALDPGTDASKPSVLNLSATNGVTVDGRLQVPAGQVDLSLDNVLVPNAPFRQIRLSPGASIDVSGTDARLWVDGAGLATGEVLDGGSISINGNTGTVRLDVDSVLNVNGGKTEGEVQFKSLGVLTGPQVVHSNAGTLDIRSGQGIWLGSTLQDNAGGTAQGAGLNVTLDSTTVQALGAPDRVLKLVNELPKMPVDLTNKAYVSVAGLAKAGVSRLAVKSQNQIELGDGLNVAMASSLTLDAPQLVAAAGAHSASLAAPYVSIGNNDARYQDKAGLAADGTASLTVQAGTLDLQGQLATQGFGQLDLQATGDIRLVGLSPDDVSAPGASALTGRLDTGHALKMQAQQIYPSTLTQFELALHADALPSRVSIKDQTGSAGPVLSAAGVVTVRADQIEQGGRLLAPQGQIRLLANESVVFTPGSVTSVAGNAATPVLLGRMTNGTDWTYTLANGKVLKLTSSYVPNAEFDELRLPSKTISVVAPVVQQQAGSVMDLSGGGQVKTYDFLPGPGGSQDILQNIFAVLPGFNAPVAPLDVYEGTAGLRVGDQVYLSGMPGLKAGHYTLLPGHYALLPGGFAVQAQSGLRDMSASSNVKNLDGSYTVSGKRSNSTDGGGDSRTSGFRVLPADVIAKSSEFKLYSADDFFQAEAVRKGFADPVLPADAGHLSIRLLAARKVSELSLEQILNLIRSDVIHKNNQEGIVGSKLNEIANIRLQEASEFLNGDQTLQNLDYSIKTFNLNIDNLVQYLEKPNLVDDQLRSKYKNILKYLSYSDTNINTLKLLWSWKVDPQKNYNFKNSILNKDFLENINKLATLSKNEKDLDVKSRLFSLLLVQKEFLSEEDKPLLTSDLNDLKINKLLSVNIKAFNKQLDQKNNLNSLVAGLSDAETKNNLNAVYGKPILSLQGETRLGAAQGQRGTADVSAPNMEVVASANTNTGANVKLLASELSALGAESILLGGQRKWASDGMHVTVDTDRLRINNNSATALQGPEWLLAARNSLELTSQARLQATGTVTHPVQALLLDSVDGTNGGAFVALSAAQGLSVLREDRTAGQQGILDLASGANLGSTGSMWLDATLAARLDANLNISRGATLGLSLPKISLGDSAPNVAGTAQLRGSNLLALNKVSSLSLHADERVDVYGDVNLGSGVLKSLTLSAPLLKGQGGHLQVEADVVTLGGLANGQVTSAMPDASTAGTMTLSAGRLNLGEGRLDVQGFGSVQLNTTGDVVATALDNGVARNALAVQGALTVSASRLTTLDGASASLSSGQDLVLTGNGRVASDSVLGLGGSLVLEGRNVAVDTLVSAPSGRIEVRASDAATTGVKVETGRLEVQGITQNFGSGHAYTPGGTLVLDGGAGNVTLGAQSVLDVSALGADAGQLQVKVLGSGASLVMKGILRGQASGAADSGVSREPQQGSFSLDVDSLKDAQALTDVNEPLNKAGFTGARNVRVRQGDVTLSQGTSMKAHEISVTVDDGNLSVEGEMDARGRKGGRIELYAGTTDATGIKGRITLESTAKLLAQATTVSTSAAGSEGDGGSVFLSVANANGQTPEDFDQGASLWLKAGSVINVSGAGEGQGGTVVLRAPRTSSGNDVAVGELNSTITGSRSAVVEAFKMYQAERISEAADSGTNLNAGPVGNMAREAELFMGKASDINARLNLAGSPVRITPGVEVYSPGDLTVSVNEQADDVSARGWNLNAWRPGGVAGTLTLRAQGDLNILGSISDGFVKGAAAMPTWALDTSSQSWSMRLVGGNNVNIAFARQPLDTGTPVALVRTGTGQIDISAGRNVVLGSAVLKDPDNDVTSDQYFGAAIYTAGQAATLRDGFAAPLNDSNAQFGELLPSTKAAFGQSGGAIRIHAGQDVVGAPVPQLVNYWLFRQGLSTLSADGVTRIFDSSNKTPVISGTAKANAMVEVTVNSKTYSTTADALGNYKVQIPAGDELPDGTYTPTIKITDASGQSDPAPGAAFAVETFNTAWWARPDYFGTGVATLAGGDLSIRAGGSVKDVLASVATNAYLPAEPNGVVEPSRFVEQGGGDLSVRAGQNILGGQFYVQKGHATLRAGQSMAKGTTRLSAGENDDSTPIWVALNPVLALGDGSVDVTAGRSLTVEAAYNPTMAMQNTSNARSDAFSTYGQQSAVRFTSMGGQVVLANNGSLLSRTDILKQIVDSDNSKFLYALAPPNFKAVALGGDVTLKGGMSMIPSPNGQLELMAKGSVILPPVGTYNSVVMLDNNPNAMSVATAPKVMDDAELELLTGGAKKNTLINSSLIAHTPGQLHANDFQPVRVIALEGDVRVTETDAALPKFALVLPKQAEIIAGRDVRFMGFDIQHNRATDQTVIMAGRDIVAQLDPDKKSPVKHTVTGPGLLYMIAGRDINLGNGQGLVSRGNMDNAYLPKGGAAIALLAGAARPKAELGLKPEEFEAKSAAFMGQPAKKNQDGVVEEATGLVGAAEKGLKEFDQAIAARFATNTLTGGDILVFGSQIKTMQGGAIDLMAPKGSVIAGLASIPKYLEGFPDSDNGIFTLRGGAIRVLVGQDFIVNKGRVFTLGGGDITMVSQYGNIDAGRGSKTASSAPPPLLTTDQYGNTALDVSGSISGSGIATLKTSDSQAPSNVVAIAPRGIFDAGDAGVRATGGVNIAATQVLNSNNIAAGGGVSGAVVVDSGAPPAPPPASTSAVTADSARAAAANAAQSLTLSVDVMGYGSEAEADEDSDEDSDGKKKKKKSSGDKGNEPGAAASNKMPG